MVFPRIWFSVWNSSPNSVPILRNLFTAQPALQTSIMPLSVTDLIWVFSASAPTTSSTRCRTTHTSTTSFCLATCLLLTLMPRLSLSTPPVLKPPELTLPGQCTASNCDIVRNTSLLWYKRPSFADVSSPNTYESMLGQSNLQKREQLFEIMRSRIRNYTQQHLYLKPEDRLNNEKPSEAEVFEFKRNLALKMIKFSLKNKLLLNRYHNLLRTRYPNTVFSEPSMNLSLSPHLVSSTARHVRGPTSSAHSLRFQSDHATDNPRLLREFLDSIRKSYHEHIDNIYSPLRGIETRERHSQRRYQSSPYTKRLNALPVIDHRHRQSLAGPRSRPRSVMDWQTPTTQNIRPDHIPMPLSSYKHSYLQSNVPHRIHNLYPYKTIHKKQKASKSLSRYFKVLPKTYPNLYRNKSPPPQHYERKYFKRYEPGRVPMYKRNRPKQEQNQGWARRRSYKQKHPILVNPFQYPRVSWQYEGDLSLRPQLKTPEPLSYRERYLESLRLKRRKAQQNKGVNNFGENPQHTQNWLRLKKPHLKQNYFHLDGRRIDKRHKLKQSRGQTYEKQHHPRHGHSKRPWYTRQNTPKPINTWRQDSAWGVSRGNPFFFPWKHYKRCDYSRGRFTGQYVKDSRPFAHTTPGTYVSVKATFPPLPTTMSSPTSAGLTYVRKTTTVSAPSVATSSWRHTIFTLPQYSTTPGTRLTTKDTEDDYKPDFKGRQYESNCGITASPFIVGGRRSRRDRWPWQVSLQITASVQPWHRCGGVLVHPGWVITAAHCMEGPFYGDARNWRVALADGDLDNVSGKEVYRSIARIINHPGYVRTSNFPNDVALLELDSFVDLTSGGVSVACLPDVNFDLSPGTECWISGWGETRGRGGREGQMNELSLKITDLDQCKAMWDRVDITVLDTQICVGDGLTGACYGDSGGPLMCERQGRVYVAGVMSWLVRNCSASDLPNVFTRLPSYVGWLQNQMDFYQD